MALVRAVAQRNSAVLAVVYAWASATARTRAARARESAKASASCESSANLVVTGDDELYGVLKAHLGDIKSAFAMTIALKDPIAELAGKTVATFSALGEIGTSGLACATSSVAIAAQAQA